MLVNINADCQMDAFLQILARRVLKKVLEMGMDRAYIEIPGFKTHELPPLLVRSAAEETDLESVMNRAGDIKTAIIP